MRSYGSPGASPVSGTTGSTCLKMSPPGESIELKWARPLGLVQVDRALGEELGIGDVLRRLERPERRRAPHEPALFAPAANQPR